MGMTFTGGFTLTGGSRTFGSNNGSVSFNGTSQYLSIPANTAFSYSTGDFTWECWVYPTAYGAAAGSTIDFWSNASGAYIIGQCQLQINTTGTVQFYYATSISAFTSIVSTTALSLNNWYHLAVVRSGSSTGNLKIYINGVVSATSAGAVTQAIGSTGAGSIGRQTNVSGTSYFYTGYISNVRVIKGVAVYTGNFVLPVGNLLAVQNANTNGYPSRQITGAQTSLLLNTFFNSPNFLADNSPYTFTVTNVGSATSSSLTPTYSSLINGSVSFNGSTDFLAVPANAVFSFSTGDFTIEHWVYSTSFAVQSSTVSLFSNNSGGYITGQCEILVNTSGTISFVYATASSTTATITTSAAITLSSWYHIAVVRSGSGTGNLKIYVNGTVLATSGGAVTQAIGTTGTGRIGLNANTAGNRIFTGYLSNIRIASGVAVYTGNFSPPTNVLTVTQSANINGSPSSAITGTQTSLLLATYYGNGFIGDGSTNAIVVTNPASATSSTLSPTLTGTPVNGSLFINASYINTTTTSSAFTLDTGDFTIEYWIYMTSVTGTKRIMGNVVTSSDTGFSMDTNGTDIGMGGWTTFTYFTPSPSLSAVFLNQWVHVAWVRITSVESLYVNGVSIGSVTRSLNFSGNGALYLGVAGSFNTNFPMTGYISNFRIVKGVGVYSGNFNIPSSPLGIVQSNNQNGFPSLAISDTQTSILLNTYSGSQRDTSTYALTFTTSASVTSSTLTPTFASTTFTNGSINFNGTSQYLSVANNTALNLSSGNFTIECWIYWTGVNASASVIGKDGINITSYPSYGISIGSSKLRFVVGSGNGTTYVQTVTPASLTVPTNQWVHVAAVKSGSTLTLYQNGVNVASATQTGTIIDGGKALLVGYETSQATSSYWDGYISNIRIVKGVALYTSNFNLPSTPLAFSQYINQNGYPSAAVSSTQTSLLLNTYTGNSFASDSSTNGFKITNVGTATSSSQAPTFVSSLTNGSASLNGTSQYLSVANNAAFTFGSGDFTIELWFYQTAYAAASTGNSLVFLWKSSTGRAFNFYVNSGGSLGAGWNTSGTFAGGATNLNTWYHAAFVRNGANFYLYLNGTQVATATAATIVASTDPLFIGANNDSASPTWYFRGYISNVRIVKGVAVYTNNFILPSSPLSVTQDAGVNGFPTAAITGTQTSLLLNTYYGAYNLTDDGSTNNFTVTNTGATSTSTLAPTFTSPTFTNGSASFNGTSQYLTVPSNTAFDFGTGDFTIEFWLYVSVLPTNPAIAQLFDNRPASTQGAYPLIYLNFDGSIRLWVNSVDRITSSAISVSTWYHIAISRSGTTTKMFINGTQSGSSYTDTTSYLTSTVRIGAGYSGGASIINFLNGYISNYRVVKGVALYTSNFSVPVGNLLAVQNANTNGYPSRQITGAQTSLLLNTFYGSYFIADSSTNNFVVTNVGTATSSALVPSFAFNYINGSASLNGSSQYLSVPDNAVLNMGASDFTIETWIYLTAIPGSGGSGIVMKRATSPLFSGIGLVFTGAVLTPTLLGTFNGTTWGLNITSSIAVAVGTWAHVAATRLGNVFTLWVNGVSGATVTLSGTIPTNTAALTVGATAADGTYLFAGYLSNIRIVKGIAIYTTNFALPTEPLTVTQTINQNGFPSGEITSTQTSLLLSTYYGNGFTSDGSTNNFAITNVGTSTNSTLNPFS